MNQTLPFISVSADGIIPLTLHCLWYFRLGCIMLITIMDPYYSAQIPPRPFQSESQTWTHGEHSPPPRSSLGDFEFWGTTSWQFKLSALPLLTYFF